MAEKQKAAPQNGTTPNTRPNATTSRQRKATRIELACIHLLECAQAGTTRVTAFHHHGDGDYRNRIDELRNDHGIKIPSKHCEHKCWDGSISYISRYWLPDREQARKVAELVNLKRKQRGAPPLSQGQVARYLAAFPTQHSHQQTA